MLDSATKHWGDLVGARITIIAPDGRVIGESQENRANDGQPSQTGQK